MNYVKPMLYGFVAVMVAIVVVTRVDPLKKLYTE